MKTALPLLSTVLMFLSIAVRCHGQTATPDLGGVTEADIQATIAHRNALHEQLIEQTLPAASDSVKDAVEKAQILQHEIDDLAIQAAKVPILEAELAKAHKACWRNLFLGFVIGAVLGFLGPKLLRLASLIAI